MTTAVEPVAFSVNQAATYLGLSRRTLYRITAECGAGQSDLPVVHLGKRRLFLRADLDAYLARNRVGGAA